MLLGPNILLIALFSNALNVHSYFNVWDQVSCPYKQGKIILCILILKFSNSKGKTKDFELNGSKHSANSICS
jgi:hypothetical protein